ncbi:RND transporter [Advenella kashmirensis W13003]|uniref:RND transporter n=1 Tax=Advenella kashmirensis W13003 TaxID=1424334 RepID=V8QUW4_9BURK|nr:RND transporter [Advenella kashmirensis W13003]
MEVRVKKSIAAVILGLAAAVAVTGVAQAQETGRGSGEVRRIQPDQGKIAIKQGAISDLKLPAMTLSYRIDASLLKNIKPGDSVSFTAERVGKEYVIKEISN